METLKEIVDALIIITQAAIIMRYIWCCVQEAEEQEDQQKVHKKQKRSLVIAFIITVCIYDIPALIEQYFGGGRGQ